MIRTTLLAPCLALGLAVGLAASSMPSAAQATPAPSSVTPAPSPIIEALREQDARLAAIANRLLAANAHLCRQTMPLTGLFFHSRDQYGGANQGDMFAHGNVAISTIVTGSPAAMANITVNDGILAIDSRPVSGLARIEDAPLRDSVFEALAQQTPGQPILLSLMGQNGSYETALTAAPGCRALVEVRSESAIGARSDGRVIQINYGLAARATDDELAVVFAHELAHVALEHRRRLSEAGVAKGFFGEFGRNQRLNRQVEVEADRMSVHLLANAGYDPAIAAAFFRTRLGRQAGGGLFSSTIYPSPEARAVLVEREIANYLAAGGPSYPGHVLIRRKTPFD